MISFAGVFLVLAHAEQTAWDLLQKHGLQHFAWVEHDGCLYYAVLGKNQDFPATAVTQLIQYLFDRYVDQSFFILRNRIFTTENLCPLSQAMIKLTAKRAMGDIVPFHHGLSLSNKWICLASAEDKIIYSQFNKQEMIPCKEIENLGEAAVFLTDILNKIERGEVLHDFNRQIASVLCDSKNRVLEIATNNNSKNKTLHAEIVLVQKYFQRTGQKIPKDSIIYTSLKPCRMCAEMIVNFCEDQNRIKVFYLQNDPGVLAKNTVLEKNKILFPMI